MLSHYQKSFSFNIIGRNVSVGYNNVEWNQKQFPPSFTWFFYMCMHTYIDMCEHTYACAYTLICTHTHTHTHARMHACMHAYIHSYMYVCECVYIYIYIYIFKTSSRISTTHILSVSVYVGLSITHRQTK